MGLPRAYLEGDLAPSAKEVRHLSIDSGLQELGPQPNSLLNAPPFKEFDRIGGLIVRKTQSGYLIVSLLNGWFGFIHPAGLDRAHELVDGLGSKEIGDKITVVVRKIYKNLSGNATAVSLDLEEKTDAEWDLMTSKYPVDDVVECQIFRVLESFCYLKFADGVIAHLPIKEYSWSGDPNFEENVFVPGQTIKVKIIGFHKGKKHLLVSKRLAMKNPWHDLDTHWLRGQILTGFIYRTSGSGILLRLPLGVDGEIKKHNFHSDEPLSLGQKVEVEVLQVNPKKAEISLILADVNRIRSAF